MRFATAYEYATYTVTYINTHVVALLVILPYACIEVIRLMERFHSGEYKKLGLNISYYRKAKGLSQILLAEKVDISRTHMSRIENNDCAVSLDVIFSIAKVLEVPVSNLF